MRGYNRSRKQRALVTRSLAEPGSGAGGQDGRKSGGSGNGGTREGGAGGRGATEGGSGGSGAEWQATPEKAAA